MDTLKTFEDLRFRISYPDGTTHNVPFRSSRKQDLQYGYRKDLNLSCQMPVNAGRGEYILKVTGLDTIVGRMIWWASNPNQEPYSSPDEAYANSTNVGMVPILNGEATIHFARPGRYYEHRILRSPHLHVALCSSDGNVLHIFSGDLSDSNNGSWLFSAWTLAFIVLTVLLIIILLWRRG
jgi:hypothetical protein